MAEAAQNRVQNAMKDFIEDIDKSKLRPIQRRMYLCSADCMSDMGAGMEEVRYNLNNPGPRPILPSIHRFKDVWRDALPQHRNLRLMSSLSWSSFSLVSTDVFRHVKMTSKTR